jgi:hypothetical protein
VAISDYQALFQDDNGIYEFNIVDGFSENQLSVWNLPKIGAGSALISKGTIDCV